MRLSQEVVARIGDPHRIAWRGVPRIGYIRAKDPGMTRAQTIGAFARYADADLRKWLAQFNMVADSRCDENRICAISACIARGARRISRFDMSNDRVNYVARAYAGFAGAGR